MAKRSDFAQKLLDDLRLRKERMAASQSSKNSKTTAGDAYSYSKQAYRGSREMKTHQNTGLKTGRTHIHSRSAGGNKSVSIGEGSKEIVPYGRDRSPEQLDLSMALAFALENGGKLSRMDSSSNSSMIGFLNQIGRRRVEMSKMERSSIDRHSTSTSRYPTLSHLHIKEIAKGAQKLNQILRACSNGLNFDRYSIEIGKELLKGAMDLEESLRMLVNCQEASEYMISPQSKTRITLLDDDEDDDENMDKPAENKQLSRPMFSFDKPSRNSHYIQEAARNDLKQRLMTLTYQLETTKFSNDTQNLSTSNSASHRRSNSYSPSMQNVTAFSEPKNHTSSSKSKPEKGRIPNVIAKLMGLEELPEIDYSKHITKKESTPKEKTERIVKKKTAEGSTTREQQTKDAGNLVSTINKQKQIQPNQIQVHLTSPHDSSDGITHDGKPPQKDVDGIKLMRSSHKVNMKTDKHQNNTNQPSPYIGSRKDIQRKERKLDNAKLKEEKGKEKGETKELIQKHQPQQMTPHTQKGSEIATTLKGQAERNLTMLKTERIDENKQSSNSQSKSPSNFAFQQPQLHQNFEKHHAGESDEQSDKQHIQVRRQIGSKSRSSQASIQDSQCLPRKPSYTSQITSTNGTSIDSNSTMLSMGLPNMRHHEDLGQDSSLNFNKNMQDSENNHLIQNSSLRNLSSDVIKEKSRTVVPTEMEEKPVLLQAAQKVKATKVQKAETPRKIDELVTRRSANPHNLPRTLKHQAPALQEVKQRRHNKLSPSKEHEQVRLSKFKEAEAHIHKSNKSEPSTMKSNMLEELQIQAEQASNFCSSPTDNECQNLKGPEILTPNEHLSTVINDQQAQKGNEKLISHSTESDPLNRTYGERIDGTCPLQLENEKEYVLETPEPLTESEDHLKQILIKSQVFLNTAEALFKLNIPLGILHAGSNDCHYEGSKLLLDCGYEVMKRKGKRKELSLHPFMKISLTSLKVRSLDDLIRQLHKDFEKLKFYGRNEKMECVFEDYLPKMLEIDVYNEDGDVNCMWDFGWHNMMFMSLERDDMVRDVEKHVLNGLLDEVTRDLIVF